MKTHSTSSPSAGHGNGAIGIGAGGEPGGPSVQLWGSPLRVGSGASGAAANATATGDWWVPERMR